MQITTKNLALTVLYILVGLLMIHWLTGGQQEIVDRTYEKGSVVDVSSQRTDERARANPKLPDTLAGYQAAFDNLSAYDWGGGDVAVTTVLDDGRAVWFFGDTLTERGGITWMPRNTSLVQTGRKMHAANDGNQIIPTTPDFVYWPMKVKETRRNVITVWTQKIKIVGTTMWDFERVRIKEARKAIIRVDTAGNMDFLKWGDWVPNPKGRGATPPDGSDTRIIGPGHWGYIKLTHHDMPLSNGKHLVTESQNWDNGNPNELDYRPMLSQE